MELQTAKRFKKKTNLKWLIIENNVFTGKVITDSGEELVIDPESLQSFYTDVEDTELSQETVADIKHSTREANTKMKNNSDNSIYSLLSQIHEKLHEEMDESTAIETKPAEPEVIFRDKPINFDEITFVLERYNENNKLVFSMEFEDLEDLKHFKNKLSLQYPKSKIELFTKKAVFEKLKITEDENSENEE